MEPSLRKADNGAKLAGKCGEALQDIVKNVKKATDLTKEIKNASVEQSEGIGQVNNAIQQMDQITQRNAANAEETASASEEMSAQTENLMDQIGVLASLVGGSGSGESRTGEKKSIRSTSSRAPRVKKVMPVCEVKTDVNGHSVKKIAQNVDLEAVIPMGENRIVEHSENMNDF
jgi:methyl-accepting chemotaxis protein